MFPTAQPTVRRSKTQVAPPGWVSPPPPDPYQQPQNQRIYRPAPPKYIQTGPDERRRLNINGQAITLPPNTTWQATQQKTQVKPWANFINNLRKKQFDPGNILGVRG